MESSLQLIRRAARVVLHRRMSYVFGTLVEVVIAGAKTPVACEATDAVLGELDRLHWKLHAWKSGDLVDLNRAIAAGRRPLVVDREIGSVIRSATCLSVRSHGLFNPAIGRLVGLWHFHDDVCRGEVPDAVEIAGLVQANPQMSDLVVGEGDLVCTNPSVQLDFGGYAKGYALDRARELLRERNITDAFINMGGHVMALGRCGDRRWAVAIRHPRNAGVLARLELDDGEIVSSSGDYERYFFANGRRYAHIIHPRTGYPVDHAQAVSVLTSPGHDSGALSEAASSALFVAGPHAWRAAANRLGVTCALLVDRNGKVHLTSAMEDRLDGPQVRVFDVSASRKAMK